jgi:Tfp pilus assembly protein PilV
MHVRLGRLWASEQGDTIVEVLIAVAVLSLTLVGAYTVVNRNTRVSQQTQEQGQAYKLVERQTELLRTQVAPTAGGCYNAAGDQATGAGCTVTADGTQTTPGYSGPEYKLSITQKSAADPYVISVTWEQLGGSQANVTVYYQKV